MAAGDVVIRVTSAGLALDGRSILHGITLEVHAGEVLALVGPNGAGKSSLLSVLAGDVAPSSGSCTVFEKEASRYRPEEAARVRSVLLQSNVVAFPFIVREIVEMGRAPWSKTAQFSEDRDAIDSALSRTDTDELVDRRFTQLSGGERARVSFARVLAQSTPVVLLDEPTAALDLKHQQDVMATIRELASGGVAVVVVLHDLSLAARFADRVALMAQGTLEAVGAPAEVITAERVSRIYGLDVDIEQVGTPPRPVIVPRG